MRPDGDTSSRDLTRILSAILIPLCVWGLVSTLLLHLIEIRSIFIHGGEGKLRLATLAFTAGVILIQQLTIEQGRSDARGYSWLLGFSIAAFSGYHAYQHSAPIHPALIFIANIILYALLWWATQTVAEACSVQSPEAVAAAGESGILKRRKWGRKAKSAGGSSPESAAKAVPPSAAPLRKTKKKKAHGLGELAPDAEPDEEAEKQWAERLPRSHPGRVLLYFSLFAIPAFGLGIFLFEDPLAHLRLGAMLFIYLWCALDLLFLSSMRQLDAYFKKREVTLPDMVGLTWMGIGFVAVTVVLVVAFFLPQPPSLPTLFIRDRIMTVYRGWESEHGVKDASGAGKGSAQGKGRVARAEKEAEDPEPWRKEKVANDLNHRHLDIDRMKDSGLSEASRNSGIEPEYRNMMKLWSVTSEGFKKIFDIVLKLIAVFSAVGFVIVVYVLVYTFAKRISEGVMDFRALRLRQGEKGRKRKKSGAEGSALQPTRRFRSFADPFSGSTSRRDGNELVRYLWEAMLAFCEEAGSPCPVDWTPREFVASRPAVLTGFEQPARYLADLFSYSEFSGRPVPETALPELKEFWNKLQQHAGSALLTRER